MIADLKKNFAYFLNEIVPFCEELRECRFTFDYEKRKMTAYCKDRAHKLAVNQKMGFYFLYLPGDSFEITSDDTLRPFLIFIAVLIDLDNEKRLINDAKKKESGFYFML